MQFVEAFESRTLFAITASAVDLAGPVTKGTVHSYVVLNSGVYAGTATETEYGPVKMNGKTIFKDETTTTTAAGQAGPTTGTYGLLNNKYGQRIYQSTVVGAGSRSSRTIVGTQLDPAQIALPAALTSGQNYQSVGTATETTTVGTATPTVRTYAYSVVQSLRAKVTSVKTAIGTYKTYIVDTTVTAVINGVRRITSTSAYYALGVGIVKQVTVVASSDSGTKVSTERSLIGFKIGKA